MLSRFSSVRRLGSIVMRCCASCSVMGSCMDSSGAIQLTAAITPFSIWNVMTVSSHTTSIVGMPSVYAMQLYLPM